MGAFHAYDIRGIYNKAFNKEDVYKIGYFLPELLNTKKILIGRDVRKSSPEIFSELCRGIIDAGADAHNAGLTTTPMIYWATGNYEFDGSVMITASHNPKEYNGLKVSGKNVIPIGYDNGLKQLETYIKEREVKPAGKKGEINKIEISGDYLKFLDKYKTDFSNLKICIDCSNGMASILVKEVLGKDHIYIYDDADGSFPNHEPNPLEQKNVKDLKELVIKHSADIGIIFDGDADRVMFVDDKGEFIPPDLMIALMGHYFLEEKGERGYVIQDIRSSRSVSEYVEPMGGKVYTWRVGRAYAANKLREINGVYGGELAGHYYFRDFFYSDSAFLACLIILNVLSKMKSQGYSTSDVINRIKKWENSGEINYKIEQKDEIIKEITEHYFSQNPIKVLDFDGYRIEFQDWWFNIRKSNTEPYLRLLIEAKNKEILKEKTEEIRALICTPLAKS